jgi:hypothetical protein
LALWRHALSGTATLRPLANTVASSPSEEVEIHSFAVGS